MPWATPGCRFINQDRQTRQRVIARPADERSRSTYEDDFTECARARLGLLALGTADVGEVPRMSKSYGKRGGGGGADRRRNSIQPADGGRQYHGGSRGARHIRTRPAAAASPALLRKLAHS